MYKEYGFVRVSTAVPVVSVADPVANTSQMLAQLETLPDADVVLFPELSVSGYSCGRLFHQEALLDSVETQLARIAAAVPAHQMVIVGAPLRCGVALYNCAVIVNAGRILGVVPKQYIPNYNEFYEARWFASADGSEPTSICIAGDTVDFGTRLLFTHGAGANELVVHVEICEAMWMPIPPSSLASLAGANLLCNLSASPETVGKAEYRRNLVTGHSGRCIAAYAYASCGPTESTADLVFGGHSMIAQGGHLLAESTRVGDKSRTRRDAYAVSADIDVQRLQTERRTTTTFIDGQKHLQGQTYQRIEIQLQDSPMELIEPVTAMPFVPANPDTLALRCSEVFGIQTAALAKRIEILGSKPTLVIGISGGLDSTLALLVATRTCDLLDLPRSVIKAVTMPGFGTTEHTLGNARALMQHLDVQQVEIDIRAACLLEYQELSIATGYRVFGEIDATEHASVESFVDAVSAIPEEKRQDLVFENVQARRHTELLMNMGFVLGTGDMSEMWLGWCTYNADHQSMYNVNCSVPKTLVKFLVHYVAENEFEGAVRDTLISIAETEISPELLPPGNGGQQAQSTEDTVGPYELHDFFMFNIARYGFSPSKVLYLAKQAKGWSRDYTESEIKSWLEVNLKRAFSQQYKRDDVPNGPKVGSLSLSPRGDWRMPSDAQVSIWLQSLRDAKSEDS